MDIRRRLFPSADFWLGLGVVLFAVGGKLALIHFYGTDQPYADQWAAEGMFFLRGPLYYHVDFGQIISTHGEHRPALTRLWVRGLILANEGQWDCYVELVANLLIYGLFLAVAWRWVRRAVDRFGLGVAAMFMAVMFALPGSYENFLWGFQSCFLFMLLLGLLHISWTMQSTRPDLRWWVAQLAGLAGLFSIAAGAMSAAALTGVAAIQVLRGRRNAWVWSTLVANAVLFGLGVWLVPPGAALTGTMIAKLGDTVVRTGYLLSWPFPAAWWGLLLQLPWGLLMLSIWRAKGDAEQAIGNWSVVAVGLWVTCIAFAIAYGREVTPQTIGVRYFDVFTLGLFTNLLALIRIRSGLSRWPRLAWRLGGVAWLLVAILGLWKYNNPQDLGPLFKYQHDLAVEQRQIVRDFMVTSDPTRLQEFDNISHRFPHMQYTLILLRDPKVHPLLPPSLTPDGHTGPMSRWAVCVAAGWSWVMGAGALLMAVVVFRLGRHPSTNPTQ